MFDLCILTQQQKSDQSICKPQHFSHTVHFTLLMILFFLLIFSTILLTFPLLSHSRSHIEFLCLPVSSVWSLVIYTRNIWESWSDDVLISVSLGWVVEKLWYFVIACCRAFSCFFGKSLVFLSGDLLPQRHTLQIYILSTIHWRENKLLS